MGWTSLYLKTSDLNVFILGTGEVATRRANRFLDHGANVKLAGKDISKELTDKGALLYKTSQVDELVQWADLVVIASGDRKLSEYVSEISQGKLLNRADCPDEGNVIVPTSFAIGDVEISIFTNGKSPLMAKQLRKKIQSVITDEDVLEIEVQDYARKILKNTVENQKDRRKYLYQILDDENVRNYVKNSQSIEAKEYIDELVRGLNDSEHKG